MRMESIKGGLEKLRKTSDCQRNSVRVCRVGEETV